MTVEMDRIKNYIQFAGPRTDGSQSDIVRNLSWEYLSRLATTPKGPSILLNMLTYSYSASLELRKFFELPELYINIGAEPKVSGKYIAALLVKPRCIDVYEGYSFQIAYSKRILSPTLNFSPHAKDFNIKEGVRGTTMDLDFLLGFPPQFNSNRL